jgi:hypothetical protein
MHQCFNRMTHALEQVEQYKREGKQWATRQGAKLIWFGLIFGKGANYAPTIATQKSSAVIV